MDVYKKGRVNALMGTLALDTRVISYIILVSDMLGDQIGLPVSTDRVLEEIALHMDGCGMTGVDQLMDGNVGGIGVFGGQEEFCKYIADRYKLYLQKNEFFGD